MRLIIWVAMMATLLGVAAQAQEPTAAEPASSEQAPDFRQVDFQLMRVVPEQAFPTSPEAYLQLHADTLRGESLSMVVERDPLMRVTELDRAVLFQDRLGLYHLNLLFNEVDAETYADITEAHPGERLVWTSHGNILVELLVVGRDESGGMTVFYGDASLDRIENVLQVLQVSYTTEQDPEMIIPEGLADEYRLEAMRRLQLEPNAEGKSAAIQLLIQCLQNAEEEYPYRPTVLFTLGGLLLERGQVDLARTFFEDIRANHPDFFDYDNALLALRSIAEQRGDAETAMTLDREIITHENRRGERAIQAQGHLVALLWATGDEEEARIETQAIINMIRNHIADLPRTERFQYELALIGYHIKLDQRDDLMRLVRSRLGSLHESENMALIQVVQMLEIVASFGDIEDAITLAEEYSAQLESQVNVETGEPPATWEQMQEIIARLRQMADEAASPEE